MGETKDRHREGYYKEYAERTGRKDRHSADYYKKYRERKKLEKEAEASSSVDSSVNSSSVSNTETKKKAKPKKDRRAYYREYNKKHPERLNRGFNKGYVNDGEEIYGFDVFGICILGYDELGRPITNDPFGDKIRNHKMQMLWDDWDDDVWCDD